MRFFVIALLHEAKAIIKHYQLKRVEPSLFEVYADKETALIVSGMGRDNALMATTYLLSTYRAQASDVLFNLGICAANANFCLGETLIVHSITYHHEHKSIYPDMRYKHPFKEVTLTTVNEPQDEALPGVQALDMEAYFVLLAARMFIPTSHLFVAKVVSDHFSRVIPDKKDVASWMESLLMNVLPIIEALGNEAPQGITYSLALSQELDKLTRSLQLTQTQSHLLLSHLNYYILRHKKEPLLPKYVEHHHKKEQKDAFTKLLTLLAS